MTPLSQLALRIAISAAVATAPLTISSSAQAAPCERCPAKGRYATNGKVTLWVREGDPVPFFLRDTAPPRPAAPAATATERDYLVIVGKHPVWASTLQKANTLAPTPSPSNQRDYLVIVGKQPVWASTLENTRYSKTRSDSRVRNLAKSCSVRDCACHTDSACCSKP